MGRPEKYPDELVQRGVRLALAGDRPIAHITHDLGMHPETLRKKVRQAEADSGKRSRLLTSQEREEIRRLRNENDELRRANEILKAASLFPPASSTQTDRSEPLPVRFVVVVSPCTATRAKPIRHTTAKRIRYYKTFPRCVTHSAGRWDCDRIRP
jgi:transposase